MTPIGNFGSNQQPFSGARQSDCKDGNPVTIHRAGDLAAQTSQPGRAAKEKPRVDSREVTPTKRILNFDPQSVERAQATPAGKGADPSHRRQHSSFADFYQLNVSGSSDTNRNFPQPHQIDASGTQAIQPPHLNTQNATNLKHLVSTLIPWTEPPLPGRGARIDRVVSLLSERDVSTAELLQFIDTLKTWQAGRTIAQGTTVFAFGFLMLGVFNYLKAAHEVSFAEKDMGKLLTFITGSVIAGVGGTFGSRIIENGRLAPNYFVVPGQPSYASKALEYAAFWTFGVGHAIVEWQCAEADPATKAQARLISACAATLGTCLHKAYLPRLLLDQDPTALSSGDESKNAQTTALIHGLRGHQSKRMSPCTAACDYLSSWLKGLGGTLGPPSCAAMTRALWHTFAAALTLSVGALSPFIAKAIRQNAPEVTDSNVAIAGAAWIGVSWGFLSSLSRRTVAGIEEQAARNSRQPPAAVAPQPNVAIGQPGRAVPV